jgi:tetratricopeptide (TPR) repeat protein
MDLLLLEDSRETLRRHRLLVGAIAGAIVFYVALYLWQGRGYLASEYARFGFSPWERLLTESRVVFLYLSLLVAPFPGRLHVDYDLVVSTSLLSPPTTLLAVVGLAGLIWVAFHLRKRSPLVTFGVVWFLGNLAVESTFIPVDLIFEHRLYFPSFGPLLVFAYALDHVAARARLHPAWIMVPLVALLTLATSMRNQVWSEPRRLYEDAVRHAPRLPRLQLNLGATCYEQGDLACAEKAYHAALAADPDNIKVHNNLGNLARDRGNLQDAERWYRHAIALNPDYAVGSTSLASLLAEQGRFKEARSLLEDFLVRNPSSAEVRTGLAAVFAQTGQLAAARTQLDEALRIDPGSAIAYQYRGRILAMESRHTEAVQDYTRALDISPNADLLVELGGSLHALGRLSEAQDAYERALGLNPRQRNVHYMLGNFLAARGDSQGAEVQYRQEIEIAPHSGAWNNLGNVYLERGDAAQAEACYRRALEVDPANEEAQINLARLSGL